MGLCIDRHAEPVLVASASEEGLRLRRVVPIGGDGGVERGVGRHDRGDGRGQSVEDELDDRVHVNRIVDRPPHADVIERSHVDVHLEERAAGPAYAHRGEVGIGVYRCNQVNRDPGRDVDFAGAERGNAGRGLGEDPEDDLVQLRRSDRWQVGGAAVVPIVALHHHLLSPIPAHEPERPSADRPFPELGVADRLHVVLGDDQGVGKERRERGERDRGDELDGERGDGHGIRHGVEEALAG